MLKRWRVPRGSRAGLVSRFEEFYMKAIRNLVAICAALLVVDAAAAQSTFPDRPVHILVGYVAGGPNDIIARAIGDRLALAWGKSVGIDNVAGASGNIAGDRVAKATPDGHTLLLANMAQIVVNPSLFERMSYDPVRELARSFVYLNGKIAPEKASRHSGFRPLTSA
jgi:tripartite-type tricarboxylate transporter receptor subunit TctC